MKVFRKKRYTATVKKLDKNLIGRNVIDMLLARLITHTIMKMYLVYLMFLKRKQCAKIKARGCADSRSKENTSPNLNQVPYLWKNTPYFLAVF